MIICRIWFCVENKKKKHEYKTPPHLPAIIKKIIKKTFRIILQFNFKILSLRCEQIKFCETVNTNER